MRHRARRPLLDLATAHPARAVAGLGLLLGASAGVYTAVSFVDGGRSGSPAAIRHTSPTASRSLDRFTLPSGPSSAAHGSAGPARSPSQAGSPGDASDGDTSRASDPLSPLKADVLPSVSPTGVDTSAASPESNTPASDQDPPNTSLSSVPAGRSVVFTVGADEPATFQCSLDDAGYSPCGSPQSYENLHPGWHTFSVRAVDLAGNTDPSPAQTRWHVTGQPQDEQ